MTRPPESPSVLDRVIRFCLENKLVVALMVLFVIGWGYIVAPFDWDLSGVPVLENVPRSPVPVDAIPDIGENQQIVFTKWAGRSPQDVEDQVSYPLTVSLLGIPGIKTVRSYSFFGFSTIYVIFKDDVEFYWSRTRVLEKLNSLPAGTLPDNVRPSLGPDATALGQVFWYTLEGQDEAGNPTGGWDLHELRTVQDWYVRYGLLAADGVSEVASVGGFVQEYQIDVDPDAMRAHGVKLGQVFAAVRDSNIDVGARSIEVNRAEYFIRGLGFVKKLEDLELAVVKTTDNVPIYVKDVAKVTLGPALRRGALDKEGAEVVGGVVVVRYGENPLATIKNVKKKIEEISPGLPKRTLADGTVSQVKIVPFYDRTGLIYETLGTLNAALIDEILVSIIVILVMVRHLRSSILISGLLPIAVLMSFIGMKAFGVDANIVALSGIAIAIGTMVDMGIILCENILRQLDEAPPDEDRLEVIYRAASEVGGAVLTAISTTIVSFLPVFTMVAAEGKLFKPLAYTKTFALLASVIVALTVIPPAAHLLFGGRSARRRRVLHLGLIAAGIATMAWGYGWAGFALVVIGAYQLAAERLPRATGTIMTWVTTAIAVLVVGMFLTHHWLPLGPETGFASNLVFVAILIGGLLVAFQLFQAAYPHVLRWALGHKGVFLLLPLGLILMGATVWLGFPRAFAWLPDAMLTSSRGEALAQRFPGLGKEFMPPLDEGSYLYMPVTMPHASIGEALDVLQKQDMAFKAVPEVETVVGKLGRVESPLDPAPVAMIETVINYRPQYLVDEGGRRLRFRFDAGTTDFFRNVEGEPVRAPDGKPYTVRGAYERDGEGRLIPDDDGMPFRLWRPPLEPDLNDGRAAWPGVRNPEDIWQLLVKAGEVPGTTSAPRLQPIAARIVMLQSGMRAPMGVKVKGPSLDAIEKVGNQIERFLKEVPSVESDAVIADRIIGKPYLEIHIDRRAIARYGMNIRDVQDVVEVAIGGRPITTTVEGRERFPVRVRYLRELRDSIESLERILVPSAAGEQIPLAQLAEFRYVPGPQAIKSEDTFLVGYVLFDKKPGNAEVDVVEAAQRYLLEKIEAGALEIPEGVSYSFAGSYENQVRSEKKLMIVLPVALFLIFLILYLNFRSVTTSLLIFSGIAVAWAGGFVLIWLYGQPWFLDFDVFGTSLRDLFQVQTFNLSVAVWVGFLALFGIATDDGVVMGTYLEQSFRRRTPESVAEIREAVIAAGCRRVRPCLMTSATTILALLPILSSTGRGSDIMVPMAIPSFGGMLIVMVSMFVVPVLYCFTQELRTARSRRSS